MIQLEQSTDITETIHWHSTLNGHWTIMSMQNYLTC